LLGKGGRIASLFFLLLFGEIEASFPPFLSFLAIMQGSFLSGGNEEEERIFQGEFPPFQEFRKKGGMNSIFEFIPIQGKLQGKASFLNGRGKAFKNEEGGKFPKHN